VTSKEMSEGRAKDAPVSKTIGSGTGSKFGWIDTEAEAGVAVGATAAEAVVTESTVEATRVEATEVVGDGEWRSPIRVVVVNR